MLDRALKAFHHPKLLRSLREHPHTGWLLERSSKHGAVVLGGAGSRYLADGRVDGEDPLVPFSATAAQHPQVGWRQSLNGGPP